MTQLSQRSKVFPVGTELASDTTVLNALISAGIIGLKAGVATRNGPLPHGGPSQVAADINAILDGSIPEYGQDANATLASLGHALSARSADPADPACAGHLHCPPLAIAVAADTVAAVLNQSLDSWDQAPAATAVENRVITAFVKLVGYNPMVAGGVMTTGGTESNLMGLLLAREKHLANRTTKARIFCSELAHFSIARNAHLLGLGEDSVIPIPVDSNYRMNLVELKAEISRVKAIGEIPIAIVATAGTTDIGSIDLLPETARIAAKHGVWLHVDAAYGGGALFSQHLSPLLNGLDQADSIALDLHKLGWQPVAAGIFLTRNQQAFAPMAQSVAYLNPPDDENAGYPSLLGFSLRTTRRADAFKVAVTLRALGRAGLGALVEHCHRLANYAADCIAAHPQLSLLTQPVLTTVVFCYQAHRNADQIQARLRRRLLESGKAVIGRTELAGKTWLKLTLLNPYATSKDIDRLLELVVTAGQEEQA